MNFYNGKIFSDVNAYYKIHNNMTIYYEILQLNLPFSCLVGQQEYSAQYKNFSLIISDYTASKKIL